MVEFAAIGTLKECCLLRRLHHIQLERKVEMDEEKNEEIKDESVDEKSDDNREDETVDEIRDEVYVNDDEIEMLRSIEKKFETLEQKIDNMISMFVDSGAIIQDSGDDISEDEREDFDDDFINIDSMDLALDRKAR